MSTNAQRGAGVGIAIAAFLGLTFLSAQFIPNPGPSGGGGGGGGLGSYSSTTLTMATECFTAPTNTTGAGEWVAASAGTASSATAVTGAGRPGLCDLNTGTTATGTARINSTNFQTISAYASTEVDAYGIGFPTLSTAADEYFAAVGCGDTPTAANQANGCYFVYDRGNVSTAPGTGNANSANVNTWKCWCANNSVRTGYIMDGATTSDGGFTTVNSPIAAFTAPNTNIQTLQVIATPTLARFLVNGVDSCHITTNIPSTLARTCAFEWFILKSAGLNNRDMQIDRLQATVNLSSARSP